MGPGARDVSPQGDAYTEQGCRALLQGGGWAHDAQPPPLPLVMVLWVRAGREGRDSRSVLPATVMVLWVRAGRQGRDSGSVLPATVMAMRKADFGATLRLSRMMTVSSDASPPAGMMSVHGDASGTVHGPFCSSAFAAPLAFGLACCVGDPCYTL